jgi:signal transduction histidine kinase
VAGLVGVVVAGVSHLAIGGDEPWGLVVPLIAVGLCAWWSGIGPSLAAAAGALATLAAFDQAMLGSALGWPLGIFAPAALGTALAVSWMGAPWRAQRAAASANRASPSELIEASADPFLLLDERLRLSALNSAAELLLGGSREKLLGEPWQRILPEWIRNGFGSACERTAMSGKPTELGLSRKGRPWEARICPSGDGLAVCLRESRAGLEEAKAELKARDEMLCVASHEMRTPLSALQLQLQALQRFGGTRLERMTPERLQASLALATRQLDRLRKLVDNLLDFSRIGAGGLKLEPEEVDLSALARELVGRFEAQAREAGCELSADAARPVVGRWDRMRLEQIATNLVSNALKYGAGKPVELLVRGDGSTAWLVVRDRGIGIPAEQQERIFGRFERAVSGRDFAGVGIGLWITRKLVEAHGGTIQVDSKPGEGSTFSVILPREAATASPAKEPGTADAPQPEPQPPGEQLSAGHCER